MLEYLLKQKDKDLMNLLKNVQKYLSKTSNKKELYEIGVLFKEKIEANFRNLKLKELKKRNFQDIIDQEANKGTSKSSLTKLIAYFNFIINYAREKLNVTILGKN